MDKMKKALMIIAMVAILAIAGSMIYYFVFFKPGIAKAEVLLQEQKFESDKKEIEKKATEEATRKANLEKCLQETEDWYSEAQKSLGLLKGGTAADYEIAWKIIRDLYQDKKDACTMKYGK